MNDKDAERLYFEGNAHLAARDRVGAEACFRGALSLAPLLAEAHANLGWVLAEDGAVDEAEACYRRAIALSSRHVSIRLNFGAFLARLKRFEAAEHVYLAAIDVEPAGAQAWSNLAALYAQMKRFDDAEACCRKSLSLDPRYDKARINLAYLCLRQGRFEEGLEHYESRGWQARLGETAACPRWQGKSLAHQSILVGHEAGYGDAIQFSRYVSRLKRLGARRVTLTAPRPLIELFRSLEGVDAVLPLGEPLADPRFDCWTSLMSLPFHFRTRLDSIPDRLQYLRADAAAIERWKQRLPAASLRIGLVWRGNPNFENDADRSIGDASALRVLAGVPGARFISLQKGASREELEAISEPLALLHLGDEVADFSDTAAIVAQLDLVISVDTAVAHLAGALGKPCWLLLPSHMTDWRWLSDRADSPWYPRVMRLFTQPADGDWSSVLASVRAELTRFTHPRGEPSAAACENGATTTRE
jgi:Flp pilus assembly protein TadD